MKTIAIAVLLATAVLVTLLSVVGMVVMRDPYQRLHYIAPPASLSAAFITLAIFLQRGFKPESFKALFATFVLIGMNRGPQATRFRRGRSRSSAFQLEWKLRADLFC